MNTAAPRERLLALDVFRGLTIAAMILVNNPGNWGAIYAPLRHAEWHGWTPTDLIFPFFLWIVGVALVFALDRKRAEVAAHGFLTRKILRRAVALILIGLFLNAFPGIFTAPLETLRTLRIPGVLQRIGVCYAFAAILFLRVSSRHRASVIGALLLGYWAVLAWTPVPGMGPADLASKSQQIAAWIDRTLLGEAHLWRSAKVYDPEGLLSTLPAAATTLLGVLVGEIIRTAAPIETRIAKIMVIGVALASVGYVWDWFFPINKPLWTSSYVVLTAGLASCALGVALWACDVAGRRRLAEPLRVYGVNALTVFVGSALVGRTLVEIEIGDERLKAVLFRWLCDSWLDGKAASLAWALMWVTGWYAVLRAMDRRGWHLRV